MMPKIPLLILPLLSLLPLAEGVPMMDALKEFGSLSILAWVVYYVFKRHIPALTRSNEESREKFIAALEAQRKHDEELRAISSKQQWARARVIAESVEKLTDKIDQMK